MPDDSFPDEPSSAGESLPLSEAAAGASINSGATPPSPVALSQPVEFPVAIPVATPPSVPVASIVSSSDPVLEERLRRLEQVLQEQMKLIQQSYAQNQAVVGRATAPVSDGWWWQTISFLGGAIGALPRFLTGETAHPNRPAWWIETLAEMRAMQRMFVDPRYSLSWIGRIVPLTLAILFVVPSYWVPGSLLLGWIIERPVQLLVAYLLIRTLQWEARRYRETAPDLPPSLRL